MFNAFLQPILHIMRHSHFFNHAPKWPGFLLQMFRSLQNLRFAHVRVFSHFLQSFAAFHAKNVELLKKTDLHINLECRYMQIGSRGHRRVGYLIEGNLIEQF